MLILLLLVAAASVIYVGFNAFAGRNGSAAGASSLATAAPSVPVRSASSTKASASTAGEQDSESEPAGAAVPTPPPPFTPKTFADLQTIGNGDHGEVKFRTLRTDTAGYPDCRQPKVYAIVTPQNPPTKQLASALLGFFFDQHLANDCGASLRAYQAENEAGAPGTRGEVSLDVAGNPQSTAAGHGKAHTIDVRLPDGSAFHVVYTPS